MVTNAKQSLASLGKELYDTVKIGDEGIVKKLLTRTTAKDVNWVGEVRSCCLKRLFLFAKGT